MAYEGMGAYGQGLLGGGATSTERSAMATPAIRNRRTATAPADGKFLPALVAGVSGGEWLGAGLSILGGFMGDRSERRASREQRRFTREENALNRELEREQGMIQREVGMQGLRAGMQGDQDEYAREIVRNRGAIAPWAERYSGPAFTTANPNAPIYNPLMEEGHLFGQLDPINAPRVPVIPATTPPPNKRPPRRG